MSLITFNYKILHDVQKSFDNVRRYFFTKHHKNIKHFNLPYKDNYHSNKFIPFKSNKSSHNDIITLESFTVNNSKLYMDQIYPMKIKFAESMYRVLLHDSGLDCIIAPEKYISLAVPTITRSFARRIIYNAKRYKKTVVITVPLDEAIIYMKKLQSYSFTATLCEA